MEAVCATDRRGVQGRARNRRRIAHPIRIMIHIHGGGKEGMAKYFWGKFKLDPDLYDIVGLSFYPAWDDSIDLLKQNLADAIQITGKDVILAETSYPWKELPDKVGLAYVCNGRKPPRGRNNICTI